LSYTNYITCNNNTFHFCPTNSNIVFSHLNKLSRSKATCLDNISARLIRECADLISVCLSDLFNKSLTSGIFPDDWKRARVAHDWFNSYLTNRTQRCLVNGSLSKTCSLKCGVPQGTILGPLLFLIYINDLPHCLSSCHPRMYADDTHITYAGADLSSIQSNLNHDLSKLSKWLTSNKLTLNSTKTEFMLIVSRQRLNTLPDTLELSINDVPINRVSSVKSLDVLIDENLTWQTHIDKLTKRLHLGLVA